MKQFVLFAFLVIAASNVRANAHLIHLPPVKIITIRVFPDGKLFMDRDTLRSETLSPVLRQRLWKSYMGTGKMYDSIHVSFEGEVLMGVRGSVLDAIKDAQLKTLTQLCLEKYRKEFANISVRQQNKLKNQFPVLFQELNW